MSLESAPLKQKLRGFWEGIAPLCPTALQEEKSNILWWINAVSLILTPCLSSLSAVGVVILSNEHGKELLLPKFKNRKLKDGMK